MESQHHLLNQDQDLVITAVHTSIDNIITGFFSESKYLGNSKGFDTKIVALFIILAVKTRCGVTSAVSLHVSFKSAAVTLKGPNIC